MDNEGLFDHFRAQRKRGIRNPWQPPRWATVYIPTVSAPVEPAAVITETDVFDQLAAIVECGNCHTRDHAAFMLPQHEGDYLCGTCVLEFREEAIETHFAVLREESAMRAYDYRF